MSREAAAAASASLSAEGPSTSVAVASGTSVAEVEAAVGVAKQAADSWVVEVPGLGAALRRLLKCGTPFVNDLSDSLFLTSERVVDGEVISVNPAEPQEVATAKSFSVRLIKQAAAEERFVFGVVMEPDTVDSQGDKTSADEIRKAAHGFMQNYRNLGKQHDEIVTGKLEILESYVAPVQFGEGESLVKAGSWCMAIRVVSDDLWESVKKGEFTGFSIGGRATRTRPD